MTVTHIPAASRGRAQFGWLDSHHSFSFGHYYDPERMQFGTLRVFNDDVVAPGAGFPRHPHDNMEIISIPTAGALRHGDSMGHMQVLPAGEVQVMSAGTGVAHEEYNASDTDPVAFFQIWIRPRERNRPPRYAQKAFDAAGRHQAFQVLVSPDGQDGSLSIGQDAFISRGTFAAGSRAAYSTRRQGNGLYVFIVEGEARVGDVLLSRRDALAVTDTDAITLDVTGDADILLLDVPMS